MTRGNGERGVTLVEVLVVVAVLGIGLGVASLNLEPLDTPLEASTSLFEGFMRQARLSAIASTSAYRVSPDGDHALQAERADSCAATTWTADPALALELVEGVTFTATTWQVCFSSRGISATNVTVTLQHAEEGTQQIQVLLGGTTRLL